MCLMLQMLALPQNQTVLVFRIQRSLRSRSRRTLSKGKGWGRLGTVHGGAEFAKAATMRTTVASAWTASTSPSSVDPIPNGSVVCKLTCVNYYLRSMAECSKAIKTCCFISQGIRDVIRLRRGKHADSVEEQHPKVSLLLSMEASCCPYTFTTLCQLRVSFFCKVLPSDGDPHSAGVTQVTMRGMRVLQTHHLVSRVMATARQ